MEEVVISFIGRFSFGVYGGTRKRTGLELGSREKLLLLLSRADLHYWLFFIVLLPSFNAMISY